jgi:hypothetical protein
LSLKSTLPNHPESEHEVGLENSCSTIGTPECDIQNWHEQKGSDTCAIVSQEFILDELTGHDFTEEELKQVATANGWYSPGGTPLYAVGNLLEAYGIPIERRDGYTFHDLESKLANGQKVIVSIDADEIWTPGKNLAEDDYLKDNPGMPGQSPNHAVQVIGIDYSNPDQPMVILNDPGISSGKGSMIPADEFIGAWADSNHFMVSTLTGTPPKGSEVAVLPQTALNHTHLAGYPIT